MLYRLIRGQYLYVEPASITIYKQKSHSLTENLLMSEYTIVSGEMYQVMQEVSRLVNNEWNLVGGVTITLNENGYLVYTQAMKR